MKTLRIDIETFSDVPIDSGVFKYVESPNFEVLMIAYKFDNEDVVMWDLKTHAAKHPNFRKALIDPNIRKTAYNAAFERTCLAKWFNVELPPEQWSCTMVKGAYLGLPFSLEKAGAVLRLDVQKDKAGKSLIKLFSVPRKPTKRDESIRKHHHDAPEKWQQFKDYCITDVITEEGVDEAVSNHVTIPRFERRLWALDQRINQRGVKVDVEFVQAAIRIDQAMSAQLLWEGQKLSGLEKPNAVGQVKKWLEKRLNITIPSMDAKHIDDVIEEVEGYGDKIANRVLQIWRELNKTSIKKYYAIIDALCEDGRIHGMFQFGGAQRTTRWAGRFVQLHNLVRNNMKNLTIARKVIGTGDFEFTQMLFPNVSNVLSQCIRTAFIPEDGKKFMISDFNAIEARVTAWFAQEKWRLDVFASHGKIYEASASMMFGLPIEQCGKGTKARDQGKVAELALGYGGGVNALKRMDSKGDIETKQYQVIVDKWRKASPRIRGLWAELNEAAVGCIAEGGVWEVAKIKGKARIRFYYRNKVMYIELPCGRRLHYYNAKVVDGQYGPVVTYEGIDQYTKKWATQSTYGGKLLENIVQATSRDLLAQKMLECEEAGLPVVIHVHDEIVTEVDKTVDIKLVNEIMAKPVEWAPGLPLKGESFESLYYKKD